MLEFEPINPDGKDRKAHTELTLANPFDSIFHFRTVGLCTNAPAGPIYNFADSGKNTQIQKK